MQSPDLFLIALQLDLQWHAPEANLARCEALLAQHQATVDLIVLPEMFTTGFTMEAAAQAEPMGGPAMQWMQQLARNRDALVTGSVIIEEGGHYFNRLLWMAPEGLVGQYDKRHLFALAGEDKPYTAGQAESIISWRGWKLSAQICYDLRFPVAARNRYTEAGEAAYDLLINVANWPRPRILHWDSLLRARAIENQAYVVGVNRCGVDGNDVVYSGSSQIIAYDGEILSQVRHQEAVLSARLSRADLDGYRQRYKFWRDADAFTLG